VERLNKSVVKILSKLMSDHHRDWADCVPKALLAYNTSIHELTGFTPYRLMFGREAILPLDAALKLETSVFPGSAKTYPEYVVQQKLQVEVTEQLVRENLKRAQKLQKAYYDTKCGSMLETGCGTETEPGSGGRSSLSLGVAPGRS